jgi:transcriptional regulator with XRE-family HTH domain
MPNKRGYSTGFIRSVNSADTHHVGVQLGRICIRKGIPVSDVAEYLQVSRQSVYAWFIGDIMPRPAMQERMRALVKALKTKQEDSSQ